ncbi:unnamed protein product, partial [Effrenium voratum]
VFRDVEVGHGHGITVGSEMSAGIFNVTFQNISMRATGIGPRVKTQRGRGGVIDGILFKDIKAAQMGEMLQMTMEYSGDLPKTNVSATPAIRNVVFDNVVFSGGRSAGRFVGLPEAPLEGVVLRNVVIPSNASYAECHDVVSSHCEGTSVCPPCFKASLLALV